MNKMTIKDYFMTKVDCDDRMEDIMKSELNKLMLAPQYKQETSDQSLEKAQYVDPIMLSWQETLWKISGKSKETNRFWI